MSDDGTDLPFGLYERLITASLKARLLQFDRSRSLVSTEGLDPAEAPVDPRPPHRIPRRPRPEVPPRRRPHHDPSQPRQPTPPTPSHRPPRKHRPRRPRRPPPRATDLDSAHNRFPHDRPRAARSDAPLVPLSASDLLVNARGEPALAHALAREIPSADSIDLLCAFVRWHGLRLLEKQLKEHCEKGRRLRVITTVFTGSTERKALDWLTGLGAEVKVSYDTQSTRLHAKAWMFRRETGYSTAYIGSSNLSKAGGPLALLEIRRFCLGHSPCGPVRRGEGTHSGTWRGREGSTVSRPQCVPEGTRCLSPNPRIRAKPESGSILGACRVPRFES